MINKTQNPTTDQLVFFRIYQKYMISASFSKSKITSKRYCQDVNLVFEKDKVHIHVC